MSRATDRIADKMAREILHETRTHMTNGTWDAWDLTVLIANIVGFCFFAGYLVWLCLH
jgi:hypothetical protein